MATTRKSSSNSARGGSRAASKRTTRKTGGTATRTRAGSKPDRDSNGRFAADHHVRNAAVGGAVVVGAVAAGVAAAFKFGLLDRLLPASEGHGAEDLLLDGDDVRGTDTGTGRRKRAAPDFRPDMDAPMSKADKEALRPAKGQRAVELAGADNGSIEAA